MHGYRSTIAAQFMKFLYTGESRMLMRQNHKIREYEDAVSPVVGVMLMLVVTIIIAAVVSGFAGGLIGGGNNQKTPTLAMDVKIANTGNYVDSGFYATILSISEPTASNTLKITTSWVTTMKDPARSTGSSTSKTVGTAFAGGGSSSNPGIPYGFGPGILGNGNIIAPYNANQSFGNYTFTQGTGLVVEPTNSYVGYLGGSGSDMQTILGSGWEQLSAGDTVTVRVIYVPTGKPVFQKDIAVMGV